MKTEVSDMMTGNATSILSSKKEFFLKITTPVIAAGGNINISLSVKPTLVLGLYTQYGPVEISVAV